MSAVDTGRTAAYWRSVAVALQGQITQREVVVPEHLTPLWIVEHVGTGVGAPRFMATTAAERPGWRRVARVDPDGTVRQLQDTSGGEVA